MSREKQNDELVQMYRDLAEIFEEEYEKRRLITPQNTAEKMTDKGYRKQEWISVDERLPDKEGTYLTYTDKDKVDLDIFCIYSSHGTKFWSGEINGKVTHWMPLPEAPKMKGGAE